MLLATIVVAQGTQPANEEEARWWRHVKVLADDALEGRQTGSEGYRKAAGVRRLAFREGGAEAGRLEGVPAEREHLRSDASSRTNHAWRLVRDGNEEVLQFGSDVTINLRADAHPSVEAPLVFAGYGLSAP